MHRTYVNILGSAYLLGANTEQLTKIYESESEELEQWQDSPGEISKADWRDFLGKRNYQRAWVDFFEDQLVAFGYDWRRLIEHFLYEGDQPLVNSLVSGLAHPLIHLGYAYELSSNSIAIEALGLAACFYSDLHKYVDDPSYTRPASFKSTSTLEILGKVAADKRLDNVFQTKGDESIESVPEKREDILLDYWNAWDISEDPLSSFKESQRTAAAVLVATSGYTAKKYDFFLLHMLTSSHAVRKLLPIVPAKFQLSLLRQWWLFALMGYIGQGRPQVEPGIIDDFPLGDKTWKYAQHLALDSAWAQDAHYVKGIRALKNAAETWGDDDQYYLKAATNFSQEFDGWGGFVEA